MDDRIGQWRVFIENLCAGNGDDEAYLQKLCGYLLGAPTNFLGGIYVLFGHPPNGGWLLVRMLQRLFGSYFGILPASFLSLHQRDDLDLSHLAAKRVLLLTDFDFNQAFNVARLNALAAGGPMTGFHPRSGEWHQYTLTGKPLIVTDQIPHWVLKHPELAVKTRIIPIHGHGYNQIDYQDVEWQWLAESPGILHWIMTGYFRLLDEGNTLAMPSPRYRGQEKGVNPECLDAEPSLDDDDEEWLLCAP
jgi:hypothetical protein